MKRLAVAWALALLCAGASAQHAGKPVSMVFVGDVMLDDTPGRVVRSGRDPFAHVAHWLRDARFAAAVADFPIRRLHDGERISLGEVTLEVRATPGHTPESISVVVYA